MEKLAGSSDFWVASTYLALKLCASPRSTRRIKLNLGHNGFLRNIKIVQRNIGYSQAIEEGIPRTPWRGAGEVSGQWRVRGRWTRRNLCWNRLTWPRGCDLPSTSTRSIMSGPRDYDDIKNWRYVNKHGHFVKFEGITNLQSLTCGNLACTHAQTRVSSCSNRHWRLCEVYRMEGWAHHSKIKQDDE